MAEREVIESERNGLQEFDSENEEEMVVQEMKFTKPQPILSQDDDEIKLINDEEKQETDEEERKTVHIINPLSSHDLMEEKEQKEEEEEGIGLEMKEL